MITKLGQQAFSDCKDIVSISVRGKIHAVTVLLSIRL